MNNTILAISGGVISTIASGFVSWFFAKRKYNAEVDNHLITNMQESLEFYKTLADDNKVRLEAVLAENAELRKEVNEMREKILKHRDDWEEQTHPWGVDFWKRF
jgi:GMP synthase PP-ATPase subunit